MVLCKKLSLLLIATILQQAYTKAIFTVTDIAGIVEEEPTTLSDDEPSTTISTVFVTEIPTSTVTPSPTLTVSVDGRCGKEFGVCREGYCCSKWGWCGDTDMYCKVENGCQSEFGKCDKPNKTDDGKEDKKDKPITKISMDGRCGKEFGVCREGYCCSKLGWCGDSDLHCKIEEGCQSEFGECKGKEKEPESDEECSEDEETPVPSDGEDEKEGSAVKPEEGGVGSAVKPEVVDESVPVESEGEGKAANESDEEIETEVFKEVESEGENETEAKEPEVFTIENEEGRCGEGIGKCKEGYCCSKWGWCGNTEKHCSVEEGCQSEFGICNKPTKDNGKEEKPKDKKYSTDGRCGGEFGVCREGYCCSKWGWCGNTDKFCKVEEGCQSEFGHCEGLPDNDESEEEKPTDEVESEEEKPTDEVESEEEKPTNEVESEEEKPTNELESDEEPTQEAEPESEVQTDEVEKEVQPGKCGPGIGSCPNGLCCSKYGWCGQSSAYCELGEGCNIKFGQCW